MKLQVRVVRMVLMSLVVLSPFSCSIFRGERMRTVNFHLVAGSIPAGSRIYLTGDGEVFGNWRADAVPLVQRPDGVWTGTLELPEGKEFAFKITRGSWRTEAIGAGSPQGGASQLIRVKDDTTLNITISRWMDIDGGVTPLAADDLPVGKVLGIQYGWRYHGGDDSAWSRMDFDDSGWEIVNSRLDTDNLPVGGWNGTGWFRLNFAVDSSLWGKPIALSFRQAGSSEVYLDGRLEYVIGAAFHPPGPGSAAVLKRNPAVLTFGPGKHHVLALRYTTIGGHEPAFSHGRRFFEGFQPGLEDFSSAFGVSRTTSVRETLFAAILGSLAFLHIILFLFLPSFRENLYYAFSTIGVAGVWLANNETLYPVSESRVFFMSALSQVCEAIALVFGLLLVYSFSRAGLPRRVLIYVAAAAGFAVWGSVRPGPLYGHLNDLFVVFVFAEIIWGISRSSGKDSTGKMIIVTGFFIFAFSVTWGILAGNGLMPRITELNDQFIYGAIALGIAMSIFLSRRFAKTSLDLELQLEQVRSLSELTLSQEREALKAEIDRRLLKADNERKTAELEDARELQLSMLPAELPALPNLDIAVRMETATEVGGDYYDFFVSGDGRFTAVIGDATGHGLKAGNMVTVTKGLFSVLSHDGSLDDILKTSNHAIKRMNFHMITMCLAMVRIHDGTLEYASAGMPPLLLYRKNTGKVEELVLKAMPLGAFYDFPYSKTQSKLSAGDIVLLVSDGLTELFNGNQESFGTERLVDSLRQDAGRSADEIVARIVEKGNSWRGEEALHDDFTILAIKIRE